MKRTLVAAVCLAACGGTQTFGLTSDDNNTSALDRALGMRQMPAHPGPTNATGKPLVFAVVSGQPKKLIAYDLAAGKALWSVDAEVASRVAVGGDFVVEREGSDLVARAIADGQPRWKHPMAGTLMGLCADADRVYLVTSVSAGNAHLVALDARSGGESWHADAPGALGAPAVQGGIVMAPFLKQWLSLLDAKTGSPITRIRGIDAEIAFVHTTSDAAWFGSDAGVFRLDSRAATGSRKDASFGTVTLPKQLAKATWGADGFDSVEAGYSAADRTRILWRGATSGDGPLTFLDDMVIVHDFRFLFGYTTKGELRWAYSQPRVELVASAHLGAVVAAVSQQGEVIALDPKSGQLRWKGDLGAKGAILGATFDADGWAPSGQVEAAPEQAGTIAALVAIARDRDARFADVKELAVDALANMPGKDVTTQLLSMLSDDRTPQKLKDTAVDVLVSRKDASALDAYAAALAVPDDYIAGTHPVAVGDIARVIAGLGGVELDEGARQSAIDALVARLEAPASESADLIDVIHALGAIGNGAERAPLRRQLLAYRADPLFGHDDKLIKAVIDTLLAHGGAEERQTVQFVADDARSQAAVAAYAKQALAAK